jgi:hypothetical protein
MSKYFIYNRRRAGLGDLLSGLYFSWRYAKEYNMDLVVNWRDSIYLENDVNIFSTFFKDCTIDGIKIISDKLEEYPEPIFHEVDRVDHTNAKTAAIFRNYIFNTKKIEANTIISGEGVSLVFRKSGDSDEEESNKINFYSELMKNYKPAIIEKIKNKKDLIFTNDKKHLGIQIRNGNGFEAFYNYSQVIPFIGNIEDFLNKIVEIKKFIYKDYEVFLSTDSKDIKQLFIKKLPSVKTLDLWYPEYGQEPQFATQNNCPDPEESMIDAFIEMNLLSYCDEICSAGVIKSTFVTIASFFNGGTQIKDISPS